MSEHIESVSEANKRNGQLQDGKWGVDAVMQSAVELASDRVRSVRNETIAVAPEVCRFKLEVPALESE